MQKPLWLPVPFLQWTMLDGAAILMQDVWDFTSELILVKLPLEVPKGFDRYKGGNQNKKIITCKGYPTLHLHYKHL